MKLKTEVLRENKLRHALGVEVQIEFMFIWLFCSLFLISWIRCSYHQYLEVIQKVPLFEYQKIFCTKPFFPTFPHQLFFFSPLDFCTP